MLNHENIIDTWKWIPWYISKYHSITIWYRHCTMVHPQYILDTMVQWQYQIPPSVFGFITHQVNTTAIIKVKFICTETASQFHHQCLILRESRNRADRTPSCFGGCSWRLSSCHNIYLGARLTFLRNQYVLWLCWISATLGWTCMVMASL